MANDVQQQVFQYQQLLMQGVPAPEAFKQAFPNGIPTAAQRQKEAAKAQQKAGYGQVGGILAGALGTKAVIDAVSGKPILGGLGSKLGGALGGGTAAGGGGGGGAAVATPEVISVSQVPGAEAAATGGAEAGAGIGTFAWPVAGGVAAYEGLQGAKRIKDGKKLKVGQQLALSIPTFGGSLIYNPLHSMWDRNEWQNEGNDLKALASSGTYVPQNLIDSMPTHGRSKDELLQIAKDTGGNQQFAVSRDEKDLTPVDIVNYSAFAKNDPNWFNRPLDERLATAKRYLDAGAVQEAKGQIFLDHSKVAPVAGTVPNMVTKPAIIPNTAPNAAAIKQTGKFNDQVFDVLAKQPMGDLVMRYPAGQGPNIAAMGQGLQSAFGLPPGTPAPQPQQIQRGAMLAQAIAAHSPGYDKNGRRINYGRR